MRKRKQIFIIHSGFSKRVEGYVDTYEEARQICDKKNEENKEPYGSINRWWFEQMHYLCPEQDR